MTPERHELLRNIELFNIDGAEPALPFAARLAREQGWTRLHADRVILEYKRYVFLAVGSDVPLCPSEAVDAAWHLHLTYTRSYWKRFCSELLGVPLHHEPTRGGPNEAQKHRAMYDRTLAAYRETFGSAPPPDIWPPVDQRFGDNVRQQKGIAADHWIIPKRPVKRMVQMTAVVLLAAIAFPGCEWKMNPFELRGAEFFYFLVPAMVGAVFLGRALHSRMLGPEPGIGDDIENLTWEQTAYLTGGYQRLIITAITRLAADRIVHVVKDRLEAGEVVPQDRSPVERVILDRLPIATSQLNSVREAIAARFGDQIAAMEQDGLAKTVQQRLRAAAAGVAPLAAVVLLFGVPRLLFGLAAHRPVGYLWRVLVGVGLVGTYFCLRSNSSCSHRAQYILGQMRHRNADKSDAALAVALFGTGALAGTAIASLNTWFLTATSPGVGSDTDSSYHSTGGGNSTGSSGGGSGCGGCGGGNSD